MRASTLVVYCTIVLSTSVAISAEAPDERPNIILVTVDTLRADHVESYGYERATTPALASLASKGIVYERAIAQAPWTLPSMASLHTGLYPAEHGAVHYDTRLPSEHRMIAQALRRSGYHTIGVVSHVFVDRRRGFAKGFDRFDESQIKAHDAVTSDELTRLALRKLERKLVEPFFLWVH
jgi:choline-sulfatase